MKLLMCPPHYYGGESETHPAMSRGDPDPARGQWRELFRLLQDDLDMEIVLVEPRPGLPDMVFAANAGFVWGEKFIAGRCRRAARRKEVPFFENWFEVRGYEIFHLPEENCFEGERELVKCGDFFFAGCHDRSDIPAHQKAAEIVGREILSVELRSAWPYPLDTCFCPLGKDRALFYPGALAAAAVKILEDHIPHLIPLSEEEARRFALNAIVIEKNVVIPRDCPESREKLTSLGFSVFETPLGEFIEAGGSAKCLVLKVPHEDEEG